MKNWRGKRILGLFLSVALVLSTLDVSTLTVTAKEGNISESTISNETSESVEAVSSAESEETVVIEADTEEMEQAEVESTAVSEDAEMAETESTEAGKETELTEESTAISEETEPAEAESTEVNEDAVTEESEAAVVSEEIETTEEENSTESGETEDSTSDEVESDGAVATGTVKITKDPIDASVTFGYSTGAASFEVAAESPTGTSLTFKWKRATITNGVIGDYEDIYSGPKYVYEVAEGLQAGKYSYMCVVSSDDGAQAISQAATLTVNKREPTFDSEPTIEGTYGQALSQMELSGSIISTEGATGTWKLDVTGADNIYPEVSSTTKYTVVFEPNGASAKNYTNYSTTVLPNVSKKVINVTINNATKEYGQSTPVFTYKCTNVAGETENISDLKMEYVIEDYDENNSQRAEVGSYTIIGTVKNSNYDANITKGTLTVTKKPVTVYIEDKTKVYGEKNPTFTIHYATGSLVNPDNQSVWGITPTVDTLGKDDTELDVAEYEIYNSTPKDDDDDTNYDVTVIPGTLTVTPAATKFAEDAFDDLVLEGTYGETLADMVKNGLSGEPSESENAGPGTWGAGEDAEKYPTVNGDKKYTIVFKPTNKNYAEYSWKVEPKVKAKEITAEVDSTWRYYGEENPEFTITYNDLVNKKDSSDFVVAFDPEADIDSDVGVYTVTGTATNENYIVTAITPGQLEIKPADIEFAEGDVPSITGTYGDLLKDMKVSGPDTSQNGVEGTWSFAEDLTEEEQNTYPTVNGKTKYAVVFKPTYTQDALNYNAYTTKVVPTVAPKPIDVQIEDKTKVYGEENPELTFTCNENELVGTGDDKDTVEVLKVKLKTEATATSDVTEEGYPITGTSTSKNYAVNFIPGTLKITQKEINVQAVSITKEYGEEIPELTFTYNEDELVGTEEDKDTVDDLAVTLTTEATAASDVGEYDITGTSTSTNYNVIVANGTLTIVPTDVVFSEEDILTIVDTYGQKLRDMEVTGPATSLNGATGTWSLDLEVIEDPDIVLPVEIPEEYKELKVKFTLAPEDEKNYNVYPNPDAETPQEPLTATTVVLPKEVTVQADDKEKIYGEEIPELTFTYNEDVLVETEDGKDTVDDLAVTLRTEATKESNGRVGGYPITGTSASVNYAVTVLPGTLTITQAEAIITIAEGKDSYIRSYGGPDFELEGITTNSNGAFVYTLSGGMDLDGQAKAEDDIITISSAGVVSIHGSGSVIISVTTEETSNFKAAEPKQIKVQVEKKEGFFIKELPELTYNGKAQQPEPEIYDGTTERKLEKGIDYTLSYKNTVKAYALTPADTGFTASKAPQITIKGKGNYTQKLTVYYTIQPKNINSMDIYANDFALVENGKVQTKVPVVTYGNKKLSGVRKASKGQTRTSGKDFIYSYPALDTEGTRDTAFKEKGTYRIVVEGTGNYTGIRFVKLTITDKGMTIDGSTIEKIPDQAYQNGNAVTLSEKELIVTTLADGETVELKRNKDYTVSYRNNIDVGTATVVVTGKGSYAGTKTANFKIVGTSLKDVEITGLKDKVYNGEEQTQSLVLTVALGDSETGESTTRLMKGKDYQLTYKNNKNVGTAEVTIQGMGGYTGTIKKKFKIKQYDISYETDSEGNTRNGSLFTETNGLLTKKDGELSVKYTKGGGKPEMQLLFNGTELVAGKDYTVSYANNKVITVAGTKKVPTVTIKGKGNFKGSFKKTYMVVTRSLNDSEVPVTMVAADKGATGKSGGYISKPVLTDADGNVLKVNKDYTEPVYTVDGRKLDKSSIVGAGKVITVTVTGKGAYTGESLSTTYRITNKSFNSVKIKSIKKVYTGKEIVLTAEDFMNEDGSSKITFGKDKEALVLGKDFEIVEGSYKNNLKKGTASVTLRGIGEYGGTKTIKFKIEAKGLFRG